MEKYTIGKYDYKNDPDYIAHLERERKEAHMAIYDDANEHCDEESLEEEK